jgi:hypothetical protein
MRDRNNRSTRLSVRIPNQLFDIIENVAKIENSTITDVATSFIKRGIITERIQTYIDKFLDEQEHKMMSAIKSERNVGSSNISRTLERDDYKCRKCGSTINVMEIDLPLGLEGKTFAGLGCESKITLCLNCKKKLDSYIPKRYGLERFLEWYYDSE